MWKNKSTDHVAGRRWGADVPNAAQCCITTDEVFHQHEWMLQCQFKFGSKMRVGSSKLDRGDEIEYSMSI